MATEEERNRVAAAIRRLPKRQRKVFVMARVDGRPREEIAAELHLSVRCVERRLTKALRACRERLAR